VDLRTGKRFRVNPEGCATRFAPFSIFEIPASLIGLETGVVNEPDRAWQQDQTLRTALSRSIGWYFSEVAIRVGEPRMKQWLATFDYGNQDVSGGLDRFWMGSSLRISPDEQVAFLGRLQRGQFPVAKKNLEIVKETLAQDSGPGWRLVAKTGSSSTGEGWLVGWVEVAGGGCAFALHLDAPSHDEPTRVLPGMARDFLRQAGCIPP
jgi:beta-lactamase class D